MYCILTVFTDIGPSQTKFPTKIQTGIYCKIASVFSGQLQFIWDRGELGLNFSFSYTKLI